MIPEHIFELASFRIDPEAHITVNREACKPCAHRACTYVCPARCYQWNEAGSRVDFAYEACLECGSCLVICDEGALKWNYPRGGFGVRFRLS